MGEHDQASGPATPEGDGEHRAPGPSVWPIGVAAGVALLLIGVALNWIVFGIGVALAVGSGFGWIAQTTRSLRRPTEPAAAAAEAPEAEHEEPERFGRNVFLERTTLGLGALVGAGVTVPVVGFAIAPTFIGQGDKDVDLGPLSNFPEGKYVVAKYRSDPDDGQVSERTAFIRYNGDTPKGPSFTILSSRCVHLGCPTQPAGPLEETQKLTVADEPVELTPVSPANFSCPCHGGSYDIEGRRVSGPPVRSLDRYRYKIVDGNLVLTERISVADVIGDGKDAVLKSHTRFDPGQHVDGPDAWLYPASPQGI